MLRYKKINKKQLLHSLSFIAFCLFILISISIIDPEAATWLFGFTVTIFTIIFGWVKGLKDNLIVKWDNFHETTHWGILFLFILSIVYLFIYFLGNFKIDFKILPKESKQ